MAPWMMSSGASAVREPMPRPDSIAGVLQHALDHLAEPPGLALDHVAVALDAIDAADDPLREVLGGRLDDRDRRAKFVGDAGDEFHLLPRQTLARGARSASACRR